MPNLLSRFFNKVFGQSKEKAAAPKQEPVKEPQQDLDAGALLIKKAEQGDADAQYELYFYYTRGVDVARDEELALKWCRRAAEQGHGEAQVELGLHYESRSMDEAIRWHLIAANKGKLASQFNLGIIYREGDGVEQNKAEAFKWFMKAAEQDYEWGAYNVAQMYEKGEGVTIDMDQAIKYYEIAANLGAADAHDALKRLKPQGE